MILQLDFPEYASEFNATLDGNSVDFSMQYNLNLKRFMLTVNNLTRKVSAVHLPINPGLDILSSAGGRLGLQALVMMPVSREYEGDIEEYKDRYAFFYMDLETYNEIWFTENAKNVRQVMK